MIQLSVIETKQNTRKQSHSRSTFGFMVQLGDVAKNVPKYTKRQECFVNG